MRQNGVLNSSPAVANGVVYFSSNDPGSSIYALSARTGAELWSYDTHDYFLYSSPAVANGVVYIGSAGYDCCGHLWALDADTGAELWRYATNGWVISSPAVVNGVVYVAYWKE